MLYDDSTFIQIFLYSTLPRTFYLFDCIHFLLSILYFYSIEHTIFHLEYFGSVFWDHKFKIYFLYLKHLIIDFVEQNDYYYSFINGVGLL